MKFLITVGLLVFATTVFAQTRVNPVIKNYGGIFPVPDAVEKPDPNLTYNIVIEIERASEKPDTLSWALNNVARLLNLHVSGGVPKEKLHVVLAIHGGAAYTVMNNETHRAKYGVDNPNLKLYQELSAAGVKIYVCGQSLIARNIDRNKMVPQVKIATSMLTTLTTYQLKGYAALKF
ncbi:MAG: DsrE family protein [Cyclobacteriaceae bacterium]|nr:DsrE family protein [Cyclobacteriaceae bacterium]